MLSKYANHLNQVLGTQRANSIKQILLSKGVDESQISAVGVSVAGFDTKNRRVEFELVRK